MDFISKAEVEALQIMVQAGRINANVEWAVAISEASDYIIRLAGQIQIQREKLKGFNLT